MGARNKSLEKFKKSVCIGYCLSQFKDKESESTFEKWRTEKGTVIIEIFASGGWDVYKSCPFIKVQENINWVKQ